MSIAASGSIVLVLWYGGTLVIDGNLFFPTSIQITHSTSQITKRLYVYGHVDILHSVYSNRGRVAGRVIVIVWRFHEGYWCQVCTCVSGLKCLTQSIQKLAREFFSCWTVCQLVRGYRENDRRVWRARLHLRMCISAIPPDQIPMYWTGCVWIYIPAKWLPLYVLSPIIALSYI